MSADQIFPSAGAALGLACASALAVIVLARLRRRRVAARRRAVLAPFRPGLIAIVAGEDEDGQAKVALSEVSAGIWARLRSSVVAFLPKVRGVPADNLGDLMRAHGDVDQARRMLTSRSAVARARAAYLLGLVRDPDSVDLLLPLLSDPAADVRMVAARALGTIGDPSAASGILRALGTNRGEIGLPAWVAAEALLALGVEIGPALQVGLASDDPAVRNVCAVVAGHGAYRSAAPQLRSLLDGDGDGDVRVSAAVALGRVGGVEDVAALAQHVGASETTVLRRTCAAALGELGDRESLETLTGLLGDDDRRLAARAADSLVRIGSEGIARLQEVAGTPPDPSARAAVGALELAGLRGQLVALGARSS